MDFIKYQHLERLGNTEVLGILDGECHIFPKIDGTNGSLWWCPDKGLQAGSRNRHLSEDSDNANFYKSMLKCEKTISFFEDHPFKRLYGEWLVPHSLKTYHDEAWRKFYIFDVTDASGKYMPYERYKSILDAYDLEYIPPLFKVTNPSEDRIHNALDNNDYLIQGGKGQGEGVVIKNYDFVNRFGRTVWAKLVSSEFKIQHKKVMGCSEVKEKERTEELIAIEFVTQAMVDKVYVKIVNETGGFGSKDIPRLLNTVFYDLVREEMWEIVKKHKNLILDFNALKRFTILRIKQFKPELF